ncbi:uncharacterized protein F5Z01DRAFT_657559 [Emericellopsis atlantica]|uniref:Uncharacterized protein n=1 Tax=Emericellopsis atlantica TaxID=2614577 RepID=A0A9P7ZL29_9HYPO|nr:uncharacterized protein F5Z01DRAFT_657559 [Emericellopsis atlantica]KAG9253565.1 hypothetical protein F5Z01DRAFT_657559 [Emericellopsis atlantica]
MHLSAYLSSAAVLALFAPSVVAVPTLEKVQDAAVTLDLTAGTVVPVPGGSQLGIPVSEVVVKSDNMFNATCSGYSWTTTYDAGTDAEYTDVVVRLTCETADEVPFTVFEHGTGKKSETTLRHIQYDIGAPYEHLRSQFFLAEVITPVPELTLVVYRVVQ